MTSGKRGCALCLGWGLHVVALTSLVCGMVTLYWSRVTAPVTGQTTQNNGLVVSLTAAGDWEFRDFDQFSHGTPKPTVQWSKLEGPLPASAIIGEQVMSIPQTRPEDAGTYRCTATNVAGSVQSQVQLFVQSVPVISQQQDLQRAALGSPVSLSCDTIGSPQPQITWTKKDGDLPNEHRIEANGALHIPRVRENDGGLYECEASNGRGAARLPIMLVIGAFVPYFPQNPNSYMSFQPLRDVYLDLDILLSFRPEATDGMLLYNGQYRNDRGQGGDDRGDFVCFGMNGAYPEFRFDVGSGPAIIRGQNPLELNRWHTVHLKRNAKNGTLQVNDEPAYYGVAPGRFVGMDIVEPMYLGGVPNYAEVPRSAGFNQGFTGSVSQVQLKGQPLNMGGAAIDLFGVEQYDACQDSPCYSGGRCQIQNNNQGFVCQCPRGYGGQRCETAGRNSCYRAATNETILYLLLAVVFGLLSIFLQFFVAQAYGFAFHNASCGRKYSPDVLIMFSLLAGLVSITCLALYEQYIGRSVTDAATAAKPGYNMDYSRGFVIIHIALVFVAAFVTICDRTNDKNKKLNDDRDDFARAKGKR